MLSTITTSGGQCATSLLAALTEIHWYALYTCANHEKKVAAELHARDIEHFLPTYRSMRRWKDRRVTLDLPLFPGYVFVRMPLRDRLKVVQVPSAVRLVGFGAVPAPLPDADMEVIRNGLAAQFRVEPHPFPRIGRRVRIIAGPFAGLDGVLKQRKNNFRVVVGLDLIQRAIAVDVEIANLTAA